MPPNPHEQFISESSVPEKQDFMEMQNTSEEIEAPIAASKPAIRENAEQKKERTETQKNISEDLDEAKTESLEQLIEDEPEVSKESPKKEVPVPQAKQKEEPIKKTEKAEKENGDAPVVATSFIDKIFETFKIKDFEKKFNNLRNSLAFSVGPLLKFMEKFKLIKKEGVLQQYLGDHVELADALKINQFNGLSEKFGFDMSNITAVHKENFSKVSLNVFFLKVAKKAKNLTTDTVVDFKILTEAAESLQLSDFTPDQLVSKQIEAESQKMKESTDLLKMPYLARVKGGQFRIDPDKALISGEKFTYKLTHSQLPKMQITRAVLLRDGSMQISVTSEGKVCSGEVKADRLSNIVAGFADINEVIEVKNGPISYRLALEESNT